MKRLFTAILLSVFGLAAFAQTRETVDSLVFRQVSQVDSSLVGKSIFSIMPSAVQVHQSQDIEDAMKKHVASNPSRNISGFRVRIFSDNRQSSRNDSEEALKRFEAGYPGIAAYRSYQAPFFRVTVGDFRTKSEAQELLQRVRADFPEAFVVKENISFPVADKEHSYVVDTVKVAL